MLTDHDFHPDEDTVRVFRTPPAGILRLDDDVVVTESTHEGGVILRHYAFAEHWYKINVTCDREGQLVETGDAPLTFAFNCDVATPMEREGADVFAVDLFIDVLVRDDATSFVVVDEDEFAVALDRGLVSEREASGARRGLDELVALAAAGRLVPWLHDLAPFAPSDPPAALPMQRRGVPPRLQPHRRATW